MLSEGEASIAPPRLSSEQLMRSPAPHTAPGRGAKKQAGCWESPPCYLAGTEADARYPGSPELGSAPSGALHPRELRDLCEDRHGKPDCLPYSFPGVRGGPRCGGDLSASHSWHSPQVCFYFPETNHGKGRNLRQGFEASQALRE